MSSFALYQNFDLRLRRPPGSVPGSAPARAHRGIFRRILAAIERSHQRRVEREAGRFIANHGGRLTDDLERQLTEHFLRSENGRDFPPYLPPRSFRPFADL
jgi:hypothetical protein